MKSISKLKVTRILISTGTALILAITACSKKDHVTPSVDMNKSKPLSMQVSAVAEQPNSVTVRVHGLYGWEHLNPRFEYGLVKKSSSGDIISWSDWKGDSEESTYEKFSQTFRRQQIYISNGAHIIRAPFIDGESYIFRIAYKVPGGGDILFYTAPTDPIFVRTKQIKPTTETPNGTKFMKSMTITPDHAAASADLSDQGGLIVLNFTELINIDLSNIKSAIIKTRIASTNDDYHKIDSSSNIKSLFKFYSTIIL